MAAESPNVGLLGGEPAPSFGPQQQIEQKPIISCLHKYVLYETKARFYLVGCNDATTRFRVLKIDRTEPTDLIITEDTTEYSKVQIESVLNMIDHGNRFKSSTQRAFPGLNTTVSAFGIVGFVRFLEGYYIILITRRKKVAMIGGYSVYKIADTRMIYIPHPSVKKKHQYSDEAKYVKMFQNVDLSSNFYFSYSYDVTHSLQFNLTSIDPDVVLQQPATPTTPGTPDISAGGVGSPVLGVRVKPCDMFVWNWYLTSQLRGHVHGDWVLPVIHGFVGQSNICVYGKPLYLTLIARRSRLYAGTRYLKRGANYQGAVANEVEIEQIVHDASHTSLHNGHSTAYVQLRGSVPAFWSQDVNNIIPKPPIQVDISDPFCYSAARHFDRLLKRHGSPVIVLNLVKKNEKKKREEILTENLVPAVDFLNRFLPAEHTIRYMAFDMAHYNKRRNKDVMRKLAKIADEVVNMTGFFHSGPPSYCHTTRPHPRFSRMSTHTIGGVQKQVGVLRVNCVDCLDRTNTAQFSVGKCLLALQLHTMCIVDRVDIDFDTDCVRMLEELYEECGDTLALQYGGSQLVHRVRTYRKTAAFSTSSHDKMQTLSRYLSNAFSDWEKQSAINLFLGVYIPSQCKTSIWSLSTDCYLHQSMCLDVRQMLLTSYTQWWDVRLNSCLPLPLEEVLKCESVCESVVTDSHNERVCTFYHHHQPYQLSDFDKMLLVVEHSQRDFMPSTAKDFSPFALRVAPRKTQPVEVSGQASPRTTSCNPKSSVPDDGESSSGSGDTSSSEGESESAMSVRNSCSSLNNCLSSHFTTMKDVYGVDIQEPSAEDKLIYSRYVKFGRAAGSQRHKRSSGKRNPSISTSCYEMKAPTVTEHDLAMYRNHVNIAVNGPVQPSNEDLAMYRAYATC